MTPRYHLPDAAILGREIMADGAEIRTLALKHAAPRANLLLLTGRADFLEKWADAFALLNESGFAIAAFDWRGQGGSTRLAAGGLGHIDRFDQWLDDLDRLAGWATAALPPAPWIALGHSMGGHLLLRWLADPDHSAALKAEIRGAVLAAPFFGLGAPWPLRAAAFAAAPLQVRRGRSAAFAWGQKPYGPANQSPARQLLLTGSRAHFEDEGHWVAANPALATGGVSWGWIKAFADSERALEALPLERMTRPVLLLMAAKERLVDNRAAMRIAARLPRAERHIVAGAAHELLREAEGPRQAALAKIMAFTQRITE